MFSHANPEGMRSGHLRPLCRAAAAIGPSPTGPLAGPVIGLVLALGLAFAGAGGAAETLMPRPRPSLPPAMTIDPETEADLFAMPRVTAALRATLGLIQAGDLEGAARLIDALIARHEGLGLLHANRAALAMLAGDPAAAMAGLEAAAARGLPDLAALLGDPLFAPLAADPALGPRLAALAAAPPPAAASVPVAAPAPAPVVEGRAPVAGGNTGWNPATERLEPRFAFPSRPTAAVLPDRPETAAYDLLREHWRRGRAAGNHGDLYDNRDRGHSTLDPGVFPQLAFVGYGPAARAADVDYGLADKLAFDRPAFGNSSTAITGGTLWRSLPRLAMTQADGTGPMRLWQNAAANALYVYPSHKDYGEETGDLFPANTPYILVSHGSSGSDKPFLEAVALILASFRPETKAKLVETNTLVSTMQMVFRRSQQHIVSRPGYMSGDAHPAVFESYDINLARMVSLAQWIKPGDIPPEVRIRMVEEDQGVEGVDYFGAGLSEQLFDTPGAVARIWRASAYTRTMLVSAEETRDVNGRPLLFYWRLLQGDPDRVRIEPLDDGRRARITVDWHEPFRISDENPIRSSRIDIGVFANNGQHDSAPAILSLYCPPHEARSYEPGPDGTMRIAAIDYAGRPDAYADPLVSPRAAWRDDYHYDDQGRLTGWTRSRPAAPPETAPAPEPKTAARARLHPRGATRHHQRVHGGGRTHPGPRGRGPARPHRTRRLSAGPRPRGDAGGRRDLGPRPADQP